MDIGLVFTRVFTYKHFTVVSADKNLAGVRPSMSSEVLWNMATLFYNVNLGKIKWKSVFLFGTLVKQVLKRVLGTRDKDIAFIFIVNKRVPTNLEISWLRNDWTLKTERNLAEEL
jgi:hypothetical protein